jgi:hypothetical protein
MLLALIASQVNLTKRTAGCVVVSAVMLTKGCTETNRNVTKE